MHAAFLAVALINIHLKRLLGWAGILLDRGQRNDRQLLAIVLGGVTIGDNTVIGAGSVVTKSIPSNVIAVGVPCRVVREIAAADKERYPVYRGE